jgi:hypothetical protein
VIPTGATSLNDIVTDLDIGTANANLNDSRIRARAKKYSGSVSIDDLRGSASAIMPTMWDGQGSTFGRRDRNYFETYDSGAPFPALNAYDVKLNTNGDASSGVWTWVKKNLQGNGDCGSCALFFGYIPYNSNNLSLEGIVTPDYSGTLAYYMKMEVIGWNNGWLNGTPFYMRTVDPIRNTTDISQYGPGTETRAAWPYITVNVWSILKATAPDYDEMSGSVSGFKMGYAP